MPDDIFGDVHFDWSFDEEIDAEFFGLDAGGQAGGAFLFYRSEFERNTHSININNSYHYDNNIILI